MFKGTMMVMSVLFLLVLWYPVSPQVTGPTTLWYPINQEVNESTTTPSTPLATAHGAESRSAEKPAGDPSHEFTYSEEDSHGPLHWGDTCGTMGKQSPIDIPFENLIYDPDLKSLTFNNYDTDTSSLSLLESNNGHTTIIMLNGSVQLSILHGGLNREYFLRQLHFHWGTDDSQGSEHTFNQQRHPLELHLVHMCNDVNAPPQEKIAVVGILFKLSDQNNTHLDKIVGNLHHVTYFGNVTALEPFSISDILPARRDRYFRYAGSLTTPPCSEQVIWTVMFDTVPINHYQVEQFRHVLNSHEMELRRNHRPTQKIGDRVITASFMPVVMIARQSTEPDSHRTSSIAPPSLPIDRTSDALRPIPLSNILLAAAVSLVSVYL